VSDNNFLQYYVYKNAINELKDMIVDFESLNEDIKVLGTGGNDSVSTINNTTDNTTDNNTNTTDNNVTISGEPTKKSTNDTQVQDAVIVQDEPAKNEIVSKNKTKLIVDDDSIISRDAQKAEDKYNMPADEFDIEKTKKLFKQNPNLRTVAISSINKEALKEIQLKAEWLYDTKKGNDERSGVYSRINWTTTQPDMKKLENTWKQYIANTKSMFNDLFKDESGNFPKDIDPIALANSDETFRKEFKQYAEEGKTKTPIIGGSNSEMSSEEIVAFGFESNDLNDGNYGIFKCTSTLGEQFGMFVQKIEAGSSTDKVIMYKFIGILDIKKMMLDFNRMSPNDKKDTGKIHELLRKYTYLSTIESIGHEKDKEMLKIYNGYNHTDNKFKGFNFNTIYCASQNIKTGSSYLKGFIQLSAISKDNNNFQYFISTVSENGKAILGAIPIDNIDLKKMKIKFRFRVQEFYKIDEEFELYKDLFEIIKKKNINTKLREKLKNNTNIIKKLSEIFNNKDYRTQ